MRCEKLGPGNFSLHADGRALDWHLDVNVAADRREAQRLIALMLAPDRLGQPHALARRMGLQEIIWDCKSWWAGTEGMRVYSVCLRRQRRPSPSRRPDARPPQPHPLRAELRRRRHAHVVLAALKAGAGARVAYGGAARTRYSRSIEARRQRRTFSGE
jgi:hypothetical protein